MEAMQSIQAGLAVVYAIIYGTSGLLSLGIYVISALALYTIAKRRGIPNPWLAWIPVGDLWIIGSLSDQYQLETTGCYKKKRKALLWLAFSVAALYILLIVVVVLAVLNALRAGYNSFESLADLPSVIGSFGLIFLLIFVMGGVAVAAVVLQYMCYYDIFRSCDPNNAVLYLVLSIFFSICLPIFLLICKNKDNGMPGHHVPHPGPVY